MRPVGSCSSMPSITGGLNGAPAGRFLDVSGWVGVLLGGCRGDSNPVGVRAQLETPLPQSLPQSSGVTGSRPTLALVAAAPNSQESSPMPSKRPISWGSARKQHHRTVVEAVEMVG